MAENQNGKRSFLERSAKILIPTAVVAGGLATGALSLDLPPWIVEQIKQGGSAIFLLVMGGALFIYYVPRDILPRGIKAIEDQAIAMIKLSDAVDRIAGQETRMEQLISELGINQRVTISRLQRIEELIIDGHKISEPRDTVAPVADPARS